jgi:hypothetical protein
MEEEELKVLLYNNGVPRPEFRNLTLEERVGHLYPKRAELTNSDNYPEGSSPKIER